MEYLEQIKFNRADELVDFVNNNNVKVISITEDLSVFTLFYKNILD